TDCLGERSLFEYNDNGECKSENEPGSRASSWFFAKAYSRDYCDRLDHCPSAILYKWIYTVCYKPYRCVCGTWNWVQHSPWLSRAACFRQRRSVRNRSVHNGNINLDLRDLLRTRTSCFWCLRRGSGRF